MTQVSLVPSTCLLVTTNEKQNGTGLCNGCGLLTHQATCFPVSPLPEHNTWIGHTCSKARNILLLYHRRLCVSAKAAVQFVPRALPAMLPHSNPWATQACSCTTIVFPSGKTLQQYQLPCATCQGLAAQAPLQEAVLQTSGSRRGAALLLMPSHQCPSIIASFRALRIKEFFFHERQPLQQAWRLSPALHLQ